MRLNKRQAATRSFIADHILDNHGSQSDEVKEGCIICECWYWAVEEFAKSESRAEAHLVEAQKNALKGTFDD